MFENVVIGKALVPPHILLAKNEEDWIKNEKSKTLFTNERYLPRIMVECGIVKSISEVKRNQPKLCKSLDNLDCLKVKWGRKFLFIVVGE